MADAPAGGGGGISGVEIILLVVLALGALSVLTGKPLSAPSAAPAATTSTAPAPTAVCAITLTSPTKLQKIFQYVTINGSLTNCDPSLLSNNTASLQNISLNVQIVDKNGSPMSAYTPMPLGVLTSQSSGTFNANIPITGAPAAGTGYVIVVGPTQSNGAEYTARVPVTF